MIGLSILLKPIPQDPRYHDFADRRPLLGIPNFWNVNSNVAFLIAGIAGLRAEPSDPARVIFFLALMFVGLGSAYYHLAPDNGRLMWDRLPMSVAFMAFLAIVISERIDPGLGRRCLPILLAAGAASVDYWQFSERRGRGDLRPYLVVQFVPLLLIPLIMFLSAPNRIESWRIWGMLGAYVVAKVVEFFDERIFLKHHIVSGHTLKHLVAAAGALFLVVPS